MTVRPLFSVVICTHNRADYLERTLIGVAEQEFAPDCFEVIVVDNASTDDTRQRVGQFQNRRRAVRYIYEAELGLSKARNAGWRAASGEYIAYLDDDAIPSKDWLKSAADVFAQRPGQIGILGGRVVPIWEAPRPDWLDDHLLGFLSMVDLGPNPRYVDEDVGIVGANMIIPRELLNRLGGFSTRVGRIGGCLLSNEEVLFKRNLAKAGYRGFYEPGVRVQHHATAERLTRTWFLKRCYWQGRSSAMLMSMEQRMPSWRRTTRTARALRNAGYLYLTSFIAGRGFRWRAKASEQLGLAVGLIASGSGLTGR